MHIRTATIADAAACAAIYAPFVRDTAITFEFDPPDADEFAGRIAASLERHAWVVADDIGAGTGVVGYAYAGPFRDRPAYRWSCEVSVYLQPDRHRRGTARALYAALFEQLVARGFRTAVAGMTLPNDASVGLHRAVGFEPVGTFTGVGRKFDRWHDVGFMQRPLG